MASRQRNKVDDTDLNLKVSDVLESLAKEPVEETGLWIIWHILFFLDIRRLNRVENTLRLTAKGKKLGRHGFIHVAQFVQSWVKVTQG